MKRYTLFALAMCVATARAVPLFTVHPSTRTVTCIAEGDDGSALVGTTGGLVAVDAAGRRNLLPGDPVRQILPVADGAYVATDDGLYRYEQGRTVLLDEDPATAVAVQDDGILVGGLAGRVRRWSPSGMVEVAAVPSASPVHSLELDGPVLRVATVEGLWVVDGERVTAEELGPDPLHGTVTTLRSGFAGTPDGLFRRVRTSWRRVGRQSIHVTGLAVEPQRVLVATAGDGTWEVRGGRLRRLAGDVDFATAIGEVGGQVLVGTNERGTLQLGQPSRALYGLADEPPGNAVTALAWAEETDALVVGTFDDGVGVLDDGSWDHYRVENGRLPSNWISHVASGGKGVLARQSDGSVHVRYDGPEFRQLGAADGWPKDWTCAVGTCGWRAWAGTYSGFFLRDGRGWKTVAPKPTLHGNLVLDVAVGDNEAWVATHRHGLYRWDALADSWRRYTLGAGLTDTWVTCVETFRGEVWAGTFTGGLCRLANDEAARTATPDDELTPSRWQHLLAGRGVNCMTATEDGLWIGTQEGLVLWTGDRFVEFGTAEGLPSTTVWSIAVDGRHVWVGTDVGLCSAPLERMAAVTGEEVGQ